MNAIVCDQVRRFLRAVPNPDDHHTHLEALASHVSACSRCRGSLALFAAAIRVPPPSQPLDFQRCEDDLAAYIELEAEKGVVVAARAYPHVWWSLWTVPECADIYLGTRALYHATVQGELASIPFGRMLFPPLRRTELITMPRMMLGAALGNGVWRGHHDEQMVLLEDEDVGGYVITLTVVEQRNDRWTISVEVTPHVEGALVLTVGDESFRAPFDSTDQAVVIGIPGALLAAPSGPDLQVDIEHSA